MTCFEPLNFRERAVNFGKINIDFYSNVIVITRAYFTFIILLYLFSIMYIIFKYSVEISSSSDNSFRHAILKET